MVTMLKDLMLENITYQKVSLKIRTWPSTEKTFIFNSINFDIKRYKETRKLIAAQGEDYTTGCLLDYKYIKNHYRLITVDLSRQKKLK